MIYSSSVILAAVAVDLRLIGSCFLMPFNGLLSLAASPFMLADWSGSLISLLIFLILRACLLSLRA